MGKMKKPVASDFLFARPSSLSGVARILDFGGTFDQYNVSANDDEADAKAMYADFAAVGDAIRSSMAEVDEDDSEERAA